jgi:hypothetical protein
MQTFWNSRINGISLLCQISHADDRPELIETLRQIPELTVYEPGESTWTHFHISYDGLEITGSLFVKKLVLSLDELPNESRDLK